jgi:[acyl-carrier-protein] S-malonyltransferase
MAYTFLFPGQGSQKVGMGADLMQKYDHAKGRFDEASRVLDRDIAALCFSGPEDTLKQTQNTQPALFTIEAIIADILMEKALRPACAAGHSLGEYCALYTAGAFSFRDGLTIVAKRGWHRSSLFCQQSKTALS